MTLEKYQFHRIDFKYIKLTSGLPVVIFLIICDNEIPHEILLSKTTFLVSIITENFPTVTVNHLTVPKNEDFFPENTRAHFSVVFSSHEELEKALEFLAANI